MQRSAGWGLISLLLAAGCGTDGPSSTVGSSAPSATALVLDSLPAFTVSGGLFHEDSVHFFGVASASYMADGHAAVVLGRGQNQIVLLDDSGQVTAVMGGRGGGPQEFPTVPVLARAGDQLFAFTNRRYVEVLSEGLGDPAAHDEPEVRQQLLGMLSAQEFLTTPHPTLRWRTEDGFAEGLDATPYYLWSGGSVVDTLMGPPSPPAPGFWIEPDPFIAAGVCMPELHQAATDSVLLIAQANTGIVLALHRSGDLDTLYSSPDRGRVTPEMVAGARAFAESGLMESSSAGPFLEQVGEAGDPLKSVWSHMLFDGDRLLWLRRAPPCFSDPAIQQWDVVDVQERARLTTIELPAEQRMLAVSPSMVLLLSRDELDVERLSAFRISRTKG